MLVPTALALGAAALAIAYTPTAGTGTRRAPFSLPRELTGLFTRSRRARVALAA